MSKKITGLTGVQALCFCAALIIGQTLFGFVAVFTLHGTINAPPLLGVAFALLAAACMAGFIYIGRDVAFHKKNGMPPTADPPKPEPAPTPEPPPESAPARIPSGTVEINHMQRAAAAPTALINRDAAILLSWTSDEAKDNAVVRQFPAWLGRGEDCDVIISDSTVSRRHAVLTFENGQLYIEDNNSGNGTFLNGERINGKMAFSAGCTLLLGRVTVRVESL